MSRYVFCDSCETNLGVLSERGTGDAASVDFLPHDDCAHLTREQLVADLDALYRGESSLPVSLKAVAGKAPQLLI
jgi:hypothetical protein